MWRNARGDPRDHRARTGPSMSGARDMLCDTARAVFAEAVTAGMAPVETAGFGLLPVPEDDGGFGGDWGDADEVFRTARGVVSGLPGAQLEPGGRLAPPAEGRS